MTAPVATSGPTAVATVARYAATTQLLRARLLAALSALWNGLGGTRDAQAAAFVQHAVPLVQGGQQAMAALTAAYLAQLDLTMGGTTGASSAALPAATLAGLRGTAPETVYQRPFVTVWTALSKGTPYDQAVAQGQRRLVSLATTDLQLAKTHQAVSTFSTMGDVVGYRRVLTGSHSCGLCVVAATQRYRKSDLMPIHPGCDCAVAPIHGHSDPGRTIDASVLLGDQAPEGVTAHGVEVASAANVANLGDVLGPVHQAIEDRFGVKDAGARLIDYRAALVTHEHGEIGPVLARAGHAFTGPSDL